MAVIVERVALALAEWPRPDILSPMAARSQGPLPLGAAEGRFQSEKTRYNGPDVGGPPRIRSDMGKSPTAKGNRMTSAVDVDDRTFSPPTPTRPAVSGLSIGEYLIRRLRESGVRDIFGVPGDYILAFYAMLEKSPIRLIGCTREDCAGFAADGYARVNGIGALCVTYCVGGLSVCNAVACAYAEKSPVVVVSGSPGLRERFNNPLLHHRVKDFTTQAEVFHRLCAADAVLDDPQTAFAEIDRVLGAVLRYKRPGYIELPRDLVTAVPQSPYTSRCQRADERQGGPPRGRRRGRAAPLRQPAARHPRRRRDSPLRAARPAAGPGRRGRHPHGGDDARQERRQRAAPALRGHLRGRDGARGGLAIRRRKRLRLDPRRLHDRHQPRRRASIPAAASTPRANRSASAITITTRCKWPTSSRD